MQAFLLIVGPPSASSDKLGSNLVCRTVTSLPNVVLRPTECWLDDCCQHSHPQSDCWFSVDPQGDAIFYWASFVQIWGLRTWRNAVLWWFHTCALEPLRQLGLLSGRSELVDFGYIQVYRLWGLFSPWTPCSFNILSRSGKNVMIIKQNIFNYLFFRFCKKRISPIDSFEKFISRFWALLWIEFLLVL